MSKDHLTTIDIVSDFPEQVSLRFTTNGSQGGDAGHGGKATLEFIVENGSHTIGFDKEPPIDLDENQTTTFTVVTWRSTGWSRA